MNLKLRLTVMSFLQFFVWGAWLITVANYSFQQSNGMERNLAQFFQPWVLPLFSCPHFVASLQTDG